MNSNNLQSVPLLDLKAQYLSIKSEIDEAISKVIQSQGFIMGPEVEACEHDLAKYCQVQSAIIVSSGTDALLMAMMALGIEPGDEVITTPYSFFATAGSIARLGAIPIFVDIGLDDYNLDPSLIEEKITKKTKAIIAVHLYGQCAKMEEILAIAKRHKLFVIEDAAQAIGAELNGKKAGAFSDIACFSFFPSKNLGAFGDGGMLTTNNPDLANKLQMIRVHGGKTKYYHELIGGNFRMDALQAAVIRTKLPHLDSWSEGRRKNAENYRHLFKNKLATRAKELKQNEHKSSIYLPLELPNRKHIYNQFVIRSSKRDDLMKYLKSSNIGCEIYYPLPLHLQPCFEYLRNPQGSYPNSEIAAKETLALPIYPELTISQQEYVVDKIIESDF